MSTPNYKQIEIEAKPDADAEPFRFIVDGKKFGLPPLGPDTVPASLFAVAASEFESDVAKVGEFLRELFDYKPDLGRTLRRLPLPYTVEVLDQWMEFSNLDPKASIS